MIFGAHVIVHTQDAEADRGFVRDVLGFEGVDVAEEVSDQGWGLLSAIPLPGGGELGLYEPRHPSPLARP